MVKISGTSSGGNYTCGTSEERFLFLPEQIRANDELFRFLPEQLRAPKELFLVVPDVCDGLIFVAATSHHGEVAQRLHGE